MGFLTIFTKNSLAGNRTPVSCVTDRDTHHYTTKDVHMLNNKITLQNFDKNKIAMN